MPLFKSGANDNINPTNTAMKIARKTTALATHLARELETGYNGPTVCTGTPGRRYTATDGAVSRSSSITPLAPSREFLGIYIL